MENATNGHAESGFDFSDLSLRQLHNRLEKLKKPGRPSNEVLALRAAIAQHEDSEGGEEEIEQAPRRRGRQQAIQFEDVSTDDKPTRRGRAENGEEPNGQPLKKGRGIKKGMSQEKVKISIPPIETGVLDVTVAGLDSLIMHRWDEKSKRQIQEKQGQKSHKPRQARDPQAEFNAARYVVNGKDCIPALSFKNAIVAAASFLPDVTKTLLKGAIFVKGGFIPIKFPGKKPVFREDMVRIGGMSKTADVRYRPEYPNWQVTMEIEFDKSVISPEQVVNLVNRAGFNVGVGEWRPTFGRFRVVRV